MTNAELEDIEAALRRGAGVDVDTQAEAATISAIAAADRQGLIDVAVSTVDSTMIVPPVFSIVVNWSAVIVTP